MTHFVFKVGSCSKTRGGNICSVITKLSNGFPSAEIFSVCHSSSFSGVNSCKSKFIWFLLFGEYSYSIFGFCHLLLIRARNLEFSSLQIINFVDSTIYVGEHLHDITRKVWPVNVYFIFIIIIKRVLNRVSESSQTAVKRSKIRSKIPVTEAPGKYGNWSQKWIFIYSLGAWNIKHFSAEFYNVSELLQMSHIC